MEPTPDEIVGTATKGTIATFWTGGWDSTFRILDLVIHTGCRVQPFYVVDEYRKSTSKEIAAIDRVRAAVVKEYPERSDLLLPLRLINRADLVIPEAIRQQYAVLRGIFEIGWQYEWLASAVEQAGLDTIEVSFQGSDHGRLFEFIRQHSEEMTYPCGAVTNVLKEWQPADDFEAGMKLFHHFTYPTLNTSKTEMEKIAAEQGFADMLTLTWFCHYPWGDQPCGACYVCRHYIDAGLTKRFPASAMLRYKVWFIVHPLRLLIANPERFVARVRDKALWVIAKVTRK